jgi:hypothetical protein
MPEKRYTVDDCCAAPSDAIYQASDSQSGAETAQDDSLVVTDRWLRPTHALRDMLAGGHAFLLCGGPSAQCLPLERLAERGIWSMAINNMAAHPDIRPQAFICGDPPLKFHHNIWSDAGILKFIPTCKLMAKGGRYALRRKIGHVFVRSEETTRESPSVFGYDRGWWFRPDESFFLQPWASWGNNDKGVQFTGDSKCMFTMLAALRVLYYLGARVVFLVGADFHRDAGYSFNQVHRYGGQYPIVNRWLCRMVRDGVFRRFGLQVFNCYMMSGLQAFPYVPLCAAVKAAQHRIDKQPDLSNWYEKVGHDPDS